MLVPVDRPHWIFIGRIGSKEVRSIRGDFRVLCEDNAILWISKLCFCKVAFHGACPMTKERNIFIILGNKSEFQYRFSGSCDPSSVYHCIRLTR